MDLSHRERGQQDWSSVSRNGKPGSDMLISNLSPATWYQIKVIHGYKNWFYGSLGDWRGSWIFIRAQPHHF